MSPTQFEPMLALLKRKGVKFVIVGGLAARAYISSYVTMDVDVCYERSPDNLERLASALCSIHARLRGAPDGLPFKLDAKTLQMGLNFTFVTDLGAIDILGEMAGVGGYEQALDASSLMPEYGAPVLSIQNLIAAKKAAGRTKDLLLLNELEVIAKALECLRQDKESQEELNNSSSPARP